MADYRVIHAFLLLSTWDYMVLSHEDPTVEIEMSINPELKRNNADIRAWEILFASSNPPPSLLEEDIMVKGFAKLNSPPSSKYKIKIFRKQNSAEESKTETYNKNRVGSATLQVEVKGISIDFWINSNSLQFQLGCVQGSHETVVTQSPDSTSSNELQFVVSKTNGQQQFTMYCRKHITTTEFVSATTNLSSIMDTDETTRTLWSVTRPTESTGNYRDLGGNLPTTTLAASPSVDLTILTGTPSQRTSTSLPASIGTPSQIRNTSLPASIAIPVALLLVAGFVVGIVFWRMKNKRNSPEASPERTVEPLPGPLNPNDQNLTQPLGHYQNYPTLTRFPSSADYENQTHINPAYSSYQNVQASDDTRKAGLQAAEGGADGIDASGSVYTALDEMPNDNHEYTTLNQ